MNNNLDNQTISLLDIIGSSIINIYYNHLYDKAIYLKEKNNKSITDCYKCSIKDYVENIDNSKFYTTLLQSIHFYTSVSTCYNDISYIQCINLYSKLFIPDQYHLSMTEKQKNNVLFMILKNSILKFTEKILSNYLNVIIDDHNNRDNIVELQDVSLRIILQEREDNYRKFVRLDTQKNTPNPVNKVLINLSDKYRKCVTDYNDLTIKYNDIKTKHTNLIDNIKQLQELCLHQIQLHKKTEIEINKLKHDNQILSEKLKQVDEKNKTESKENSNDDFMFKFAGPEYVD